MRETEHMQSREDYDAFVASLPEAARAQWWPVPWRLATARERVFKVALWFLGIGVIVSGALTLIGAFNLSVDGISRGIERHDVCLKLARTGHEVVECDR